MPIQKYTYIEISIVRMNRYSSKNKESRMDAEFSASIRLKSWSKRQDLNSNKKYSNYKGLDIHHNYAVLPSFRTGRGQRCDQILQPFQLSVD